MEREAVKQYLYEKDMLRVLNADIAKDLPYVACKLIADGFSSITLKELAALSGTQFKSREVWPLWSRLLKEMEIPEPSVAEAIWCHVLPWAQEIAKLLGEGKLEVQTAVDALEELNRYGHPAFLTIFCVLCSDWHHHFQNNLKSIYRTEQEVREAAKLLLETRQYDPADVTAQSLAPFEPGSYHTRVSREGHLLGYALD